MSTEKRKYKQYLVDKNVPLTKYARSQLLKKVQNQNESELIDESPPIQPCTASYEAGECVKENVMDIDVSKTSDMDSIFLQEVQDEIDSSLNSFENEYDTETSDTELYSSDDDELLQLLRSKDKSSKNIRDLINDENFCQSMSFNVNRSPAELLLMTLKYSLKNKLPLTGISDLLKFVNIICGQPVLPESRYGVDKLCNSPENVTLHAVCETCSHYIGAFEMFNSVINCENCNTELDLRNPSSRCFFAVLDPSDAIRDIIQSNEVYYNSIVKHWQHEKEHIKDIYDGALYNRFRQNLRNEDKYSYVTCIFNTDGAPVFKSSAYSIWPIYIILNEIPLQQRFNNAITCALWFGRNKPDMSVFLDKFVEIMNKLSIDGIPCKIEGEDVILKVYSLLSSVDSVARAPMNGTTQFNGKYGCDWCLHPGTFSDGSMRYPYQVPLPKDRSHASTIQHATEAIETNRRIFGVITASPLLQLNNFDIVNGFTPDYMHCFAAGVVKQFTELLLRHLTKIDVDHMDNIFKNIKVPYQIGRLTRVLKDRENWKAKEYENWALYYSIPLLSTVLKNNTLFEHWSLLVEALHISLKKDITFSELNHVNEILHKFVKNADIYSLSALTYNVHQLLHLPTSIYNWGPLFAHSTYPFESANHKLLNAIHCAKGVILQIVRYENLQRCVQILETSLHPTPIVSRYCEILASNLTKKVFKVSSITYFGKQSIIASDLAEKFDISKAAKVFHKMVLGGTLYMSCKKINKRSCNYYVKLANGDFCKIICFVVDMEKKKECSICQIIKSRPYKYTSVIRIFSEFSNVTCIKTKEISATCVFIEADNKKFIVPAPNQLHY